MLKGGEPRLVYYPEYGDENSGVLQTRSMTHLFLVQARAKAWATSPASRPRFA